MTTSAHGAIEHGKVAGIAYGEHGEGPVAIYLHGIGGGDASFTNQLTGITRMRNIAWNMPGYGESERGIWPPSFETLSRSLSGFIEALGVGKVHLVGHSIGGMVALEHAVRFPQQVASLAIIGSTPSFGGRDETFKQEFLKARLAPLDAGHSMIEIAKTSTDAMVGPSASDECKQAVSAPMGQVNAETWRGILQCLVTFNRRDDLSSVKQPCCLIAGGFDTNAPPRTMEKMAEKMPNANYHIIAQAGHMINQEAASETNAILQNFFDSQRA